MEKRSSTRFVWIGKEVCPFSGFHEHCGEDGCSAVLVSEDQDPDTICTLLQDLCHPETPWMVYGSEDCAERWFDAGAAGFIPSGTSEKIAKATLHRISELLESARGKNPLSGLPGNVSIRSRLESDVLNGNSLAAYFDISGFKPFNDYYGFSRGDAVLRTVAAILTDILPGYFIGHIGGDDFIAVGEGGEFIESVKRVKRIFNGRAGGFYSGRDHAAGGIEALDRSGDFRFYPLMDLTVSLIDGAECSDVEELAGRAGLEKKRLKGELLPDTVASFLSSGEGEAEYQDFEEWLVNHDPDILQIKALIESAGILGDRKMTDCLVDILNRQKDHKIRKSAARALGNIAGPSSAHALKMALSDRNVHVRTAATMALPFVMGREAGPLLQNAVKDTNTWVRRAALRGLGISGWPGTADILECEFQRNDMNRFWLNHRQELNAALEGAAFLGDPRLAPSVAAVLRNSRNIDREKAWKALLTLGGPVCVTEMLRAINSGEYYEIIQQLDVFDPHGVPRERIEELETILSDLELKRRTDRISILRFLGRIQGTASDKISRSLLDSLNVTGDPDEFEALLETLKSREIPPRGYDLARIVDRIASGRLKLSRKGIVSMLRWASMGKYALSKTYLEELLRHDSREIRIAAARTVISLARKKP